MGIPFEKLSQQLKDRIRASNPDAFCAVEAKVAKPVEATALDRSAPEHKAGARSLGISVDLIVCSKRLMDSHDNLRSALKPLVDAIAKSLGLDDGDKRVSWRYHQVKVSNGEGVIVRIETKL